jgi:hypothetical protein
MGFWWFGRKSAPPDMRPFVPAWLSSAEAEEGFARSRDGLIAFVKSTSVWALFKSSSWELGSVRGSTLVLAGQQVVGARAAAIAAPSGGSTIDAESRSAIGQILTALRQHGLIET